MHKLPVTFLVIMHNEEIVLRRCLDSIAGLSDDILIVHDGPCADRSIEIAKEYSSRVYEWDKKGNAEHHRSRAIGEAEYEWVFQIDADEYLSEELKSELPKLLDTKTDVWAFEWPILIDGKYVPFGKKRALFKKSRVYFIPVNHEYVKPIDKTVVITDSDLLLEHKPKNPHFMYESFSKRLIPRAKIHAKRLLVPFELYDKWNCKILDWEPQTRIRLSHPLILGVPLSFAFLYLLCVGKAIRYRNPIYLKIGLTLASWHSSVYYFYWKFKRQSRLGIIDIVHGRKKEIKLPISGYLVIHNEERTLERCLDSFADLVDEIIVIHDGPCNDRSIEIAKRFTDKVFIFPKKGNAEPHRTEAMRIAKHDWILQMDADEYLSSDIREALGLCISGRADAWDFEWPIWHKGRYYSFGYKRALYNKQKVYFIPVPHEYVKPISADVKVQRSEYRLNHKPDKVIFSFGYLRERLIPRAKFRAEMLTTPFSKFDKWNCHIDDWEEGTRIRLKYPYLVGALGSFVYLFGICLIKTIKERSLFYVIIGIIIGIEHGATFYYYGKKYK